MNESQLIEFYSMKEQMKQLTKEQAEMRQEIRDGFARNDEKHEEMLQRFTKHIEEAIANMGKELDKKADKDNSWAERVWIGLFGIVGAGIIGAVGYAIVHAYKTM